MRARMLLTGITLGATLLVGGAATAQAAPAAPPATKVAAATWHYLDTLDSRAICENVAAQVRRDNGVPTQCRGPYSDGVFTLWYWA